MVRLQKYMADAGIASRRKSEELILQGKVKVNGQIIKELGFRVKPGEDLVEFAGKEVQVDQRRMVVLLNKPQGVISSVVDPGGRKTVIDLIPDRFPRLYPVGRLDFDSEGMILLTNDGQLADLIMHPKNEIKKVYHVWVYGYPSQEAMDLFAQGLDLEDGLTAPAKIKLIRKGRSSSLMEVEIIEGKKRQIRRMFEHLGYPVAKLSRVQIGQLRMTKLAEGKYRVLKDNEIRQLTRKDPPVKSDKREYKR